MPRGKHHSGRPGRTGQPSSRSDRGSTGSGRPQPSETVGGPGTSAVRRDGPVDTANSDPPAVMDRVEAGGVVGGEDGWVTFRDRAYRAASGASATVVRDGSIPGNGAIGAVCGAPTTGFNDGSIPVNSARGAVGGAPTTGSDDGTFTVEGQRIEYLARYRAAAWAAIRRELRALERAGVVLPEEDFPQPRFTPTPVVPGLTARREVLVDPGVTAFTGRRDPRSCVTGEDPVYVPPASPGRQAPRRVSHAAWQPVPA